MEKEQPVKRGRGQPTKYKPEYCSEIIKLAEECEPYDFACSAAVLFEICGDTLHEWRRRHPDFSDAYKRALKIWGKRMTQFFLENKIDYRYYRSLRWQVMRERIEPDERKEVTHKIESIDEMLTAMDEEAT